jgi:hypothetical protein
MTKLFSMTRLIGLLVVFCLIPQSYGRLKETWDYERLTREATLIVIATPTEIVPETDANGEVVALPNIGSASGYGTVSPLMAKGVDTKFQVLTVLKGPATTKGLVLHHFKLPVTGQPMINGPGLVSFDPKEKKRFLLFLHKDEKDRWVAVSGQTDPDDAILEISRKYP